MKRSILTACSAIALLTIAAPSTFAVSERLEERSNDARTTLNALNDRFKQERQETMNALGDRFKQERQETMNALGDRFKQERQETMNA